MSPTIILVVSCHLNISKFGKPWKALMSLNVYASKWLDAKKPKQWLANVVHLLNDIDKQRHWDKIFGNPRFLYGIETNKFEGEIPKNLGNLKVFHMLNLSNNVLIPIVFGILYKPGIIRSRSFSKYASWRDSSTTSGAHLPFFLECVS